MYITTTVYIVRTRLLYCIYILTGDYCMIHTYVYTRYCMYECAVRYITVCGITGRSVLIGRTFLLQQQQGHLPQFVARRNSKRTLKPLRLASVTSSFEFAEREVTLAIRHHAKGSRTREAFHILSSRKTRQSYRHRRKLNFLLR
jgi:hypothetical protein